MSVCSVQAELNLQFSLFPKTTEVLPIPLRLNTKFHAHQQPLNVDHLDVKKIAEINLEKNVTLIKVMSSVLVKIGDLTLKKFKTPEMLKLQKPQLIEKTQIVRLFKTESLNSVPGVLIKLNFKAPLVIQADYQTASLIEISSDEYKLIQALLLLNLHKKYESAMSLLIDLMDSSQYKLQAQYHYAIIAKQFDLNSEFRSLMLSAAMTTENDLKKLALGQLIQNAQALQINDTRWIEEQIEKLNMQKNQSANYDLKRAQYLLSQGDLKASVNSLLKIAVTSKEIISARLLLSTAFYRMGELDNAVSYLEKISQQADNLSASPLKNLYYLTLARLYFQKSNYKTSYQYYLKIEKSSGLWLQSSIEQATAQIMAGDFVGAAGNMFSLHTDYFKKAYAPESYLIRAAGYLNLCQFGDAVTVVAELQKRYSEMGKIVNNFQEQHKNPQDYYQIVKNILQNVDLTNTAQSNSNIVPRPFAFELARSPEFLNIQKKINMIEDESNRFKQIPNRFAIQVTHAQLEIAKIIKIKKEQLKKLTADDISTLDQKVLALESEILILKSSTAKIERMRQLASKRDTIEKNKLKLMAANVLQNSFSHLQNSLVEIMEQKDLLAYEIYSGAGEHLRYQMAGGTAPERAPATALTPEEKMSYRWKFKGEVWEDEVGHYRSSLANICPQTDNKNK